MIQAPTLQKITSSIWTYGAELWGFAKSSNINSINFAVQSSTQNRKHTLLIQQSNPPILIWNSKCQWSNPYPIPKFLSQSNRSTESSRTIFFPGNPPRRWTRNLFLQPEDCQCWLDSFITSSRLRCWVSSVTLNKLYILNTTFADINIIYSSKPTK